MSSSSYVKQLFRLKMKYHQTEIGHHSIKECALTQPLKSQQNKIETILFVDYDEKMMAWRPAVGTRCRRASRHESHVMDFDPAVDHYN